MSIQPVVGLPGAYPPKLSTRREIFLHPDRVSYRFSGRFLHKYAKDWESATSPSTLKAGTLLALRKLRFPGESQSRLYWFPAVLTINHTSDTNQIILPSAFRNYSYMFGTNCRFTRVRVDSNFVMQFQTVAAAGVNVTDSGVVITVDPSSGVNNTWANQSILLYSGLEGPSAQNSPLEHYVAFSVLPSDTLLGIDDMQLHHYPWSGIVRGDMLYPRRPSGSDATRNVVLRRFLKAAASAGLTGLLVDEALTEE
jgi:hypothetical protein